MSKSRAVMALALFLLTSIALHAGAQVCSATFTPGTLTVVPGGPQRRITITPDLASVPPEALGCTYRVDNAALAEKGLRFLPEESHPSREGNGIRGADKALFPEANAQSSWVDVEAFPFFADGTKGEIVTITNAFMVEVDAPKPPAEFLFAIDVMPPTLILAPTQGGAITINTRPQPGSAGAGSIHYRILNPVDNVGNIEALAMGPGFPPTIMKVFVSPGAPQGTHSMSIHATIKDDSGKQIAEKEFPDAFTLTIPPAAPVPEFNFTIPESVDVTAGQESDVALSLQADGFSGALNVQVYPPPGISIDQPKFTIGTGEEKQIHIRVALNAPAKGTLEVQAQTTLGGQMVLKVLRVRVNVAQPVPTGGAVIGAGGDFRFELEPINAVMPPEGGREAVTLTISSVNGSHGPVTIDTITTNAALSVEGRDCTLSPYDCVHERVIEIPADGEVKVEFFAVATAQLEEVARQMNGARSIIFLAKAPGLSNQRLTYIVELREAPAPLKNAYALSIEPPMIDLDAGGEARTFEIRLTPEPGFNKGVALTFDGYHVTAPVELKLGPGEAVFQAGQYSPRTVTIQAKAGARTGQFSMTVRGMTSDRAAHEQAWVELPITIHEALPAATLSIDAGDAAFFYPATKDVKLRIEGGPGPVVVMVSEGGPFEIVPSRIEVPSLPATVDVRVGLKQAGSGTSSVEWEVQAPNGKRLTAQSAQFAALDSSQGLTFSAPAEFSISPGEEKSFEVTLQAGTFKGPVQLAISPSIGLEVIGQPVIQTAPLAESPAMTLRVRARSETAAGEAGHSVKLQAYATIGASEISMGSHKIQVAIVPSAYVPPVEPGSLPVSFPAGARIIRNIEYNKCLTAGGQNDGTLFILQDCRPGDPAQLFTFGTNGEVRNQMKCAVLNNSSTDDDTSIVVWGCNGQGQANEIWTLDSSRRIIGRTHRKCMEPNEGTANGDLYLRPCWEGNNQKWDLAQQQAGAPPPPIPSTPQFKVVFNGPDDTLSTDGDSAGLEFAVHGEKGWNGVIQMTARPHRFIEAQPNTFELDTRNPDRAQVRLIINSNGADVRMGTRDSFTFTAKAGPGGVEKLVEVPINRGASTIPDHPLPIPLPGGPLEYVSQGLVEIAQDIANANPFVEDFEAAIAENALLNPENAQTQMAFLHLHRTIMEQLRNPVDLLAYENGEPAIDPVILARMIERSGVFERERELQRTVQEVASLGLVPLAAITSDAALVPPTSLRQRVTWSEYTSAEILVLQICLRRLAEVSQPGTERMGEVLGDFEDFLTKAGATEDNEKLKKAKRAFKALSLAGSLVSIADVTAKAVLAYMPNEITSFHSVINDTPRAAGSPPIAIKKDGDAQIKFLIRSKSTGGSILTPFQVTSWLYSQLPENKLSKLWTTVGDRLGMKKQMEDDLKAWLSKRIQADPFLKQWLSDARAAWDIKPFYNRPTEVNSTRVMFLKSKDESVLEASARSDGGSKKSFHLTGKQKTAVGGAGYTFGLGLKLVNALQPACAEDCLKTGLWDLAGVVTVTDEDVLDARHGKPCTTTENTGCTMNKWNCRGYAPCKCLPDPAFCAH